MDFAPNGYQIATGSGDDTVRIWDLRALKSQYIIPAHKSSVSDLKFFRSTAENPFASLDALIPAAHTANGSVNGNGTADVEMNGTNGVEEKPDAEASAAAGSAAMVHGSNDGLPRSGLFLVTAGFDCSVKVWSADEWSMVRNLPTDAGKVMSVDVSGDGKFIGSASYSRSFHLFGGEHTL